MAEIGSWEEAEDFGRSRSKHMTPDERLAWLRHMHEFARRSGAFQKARRKKLENTWKYGKQ